jgi:hypothetical protein
MERREFLEFSSVAGAALLIGSSTASAATTSTTYPKPAGAVTYYSEIRVAGPEKATVLAKIDDLITLMQTKTGYLSLSFKQTIGESTMGRAYPNTTKGWLAEGFATVNGVLASPKVPYFYVMFLRFDSYDNFVASGVQAWFTANIVPSLFAYAVVNGTPTKTAVALDYYEGVYTTVGCADRSVGYGTEAEIKTYLASKQSDEVANHWVSVNNHYMILDSDQAAHYDLLRSNLFGNTMSIFRPIEGDVGYDGVTADYAINGQPGLSSNTFFRKALTREILQNAFPDGDKRSYLMHGVWETIMDHENSHIDPRFAAGASQVGSYMLAHPVEPFYITAKQDRFISATL